jgi:uncharacterized SAM-binding protein YcdF (DUF218 family)
MTLIDPAKHFVIPKQRARRWLAGLLAGLAAVLGLHPLLLPPLAQALVVNQPPAPADAIVVLGGGSGDREVTAARLYAQGLSDTILTTGGSVPLPGLQEVTWAGLSAAALERLGVPARAVVQIPGSDSTCSDARLALARLRPDAKRVMIVTDPYHTRRAQWLFQRGAPGLEVLAIAADPSWFDAARWWQDEQGLIVVAQEYVKFALTLVKGCG